ncbi:MULTISPECIES: glucose-1-phosphate adenylyltransferase [Piscirickettsiaceae]|jgi:glucose-1-phosphate adenylyltransferase|uniref:Glucose-1-phosphate adenylyltransferase n=1 Tax=Hydrogenovibrio thermophilus TaxID=265883 RepID=A0A410H1E9_9GAMM|nr:MULTISPECIES: glucose-1-phosphate adenylyltransferase [Piscirickettsiaceae]AZR82692.1 glucose-1-phosphate adenylyltransferase [Thiomicrospira sp. S5]QAB14740.1 glucose-1-phosphate adenylyltransferase [Hydrogenovibrio thermophilus]
MKYYCETKTATDLTRKTLALVLAGGEGSRLKELTKWRAKPAVPFGGKYRIVDFVLSNCVNSGIRKIGVLTQYKSHSLIRHIQRAWSFMRYEVGEFVELLPAQQRVDKGWYKGTADALYQNLDILRRHTPEYVLVLGGDHIYSMDYSKMLYEHAESGADVTIGCIEVPRMEATGFGVMSVNENLEITKFTEKPADPEPMPGKPDKALASMGIYVFSTEFLFEKLIEDADNMTSSRDFGKDIIPSVIADWHVRAFPFQDDDGSPVYWRDVGTIESYWKASMDLCSVTPELNLYDDDWPIWTYQAQMPPAKFIFDDEGRRGEAIDSLTAGGCIVSGARIKRSVISSGGRIHSYTLIKDSVLLPRVEVQRNCRIQNAVIDKGCIIPEGTIIGENLEDDKRRFYVEESSGIVLVTPDMLGQKLHVTR